MKKEDKFATHAFNEALKSELHLKHGSIITKNGKIVATGYNKGNRTKIMGQIHSCVHAEIDAASKIVKVVSKQTGNNSRLMKKKLRNYEVWAVRACQIDNHKKVYGIRFSKPCNCCINKLKSLGFSKIAYSTNDGNIVHEKLDNMKGYSSSSQKKYGKHYRY